jgi:tetratricopeptide (TPR) repeat protein
LPARGNFGRVGDVCDHEPRLFSGHLAAGAGLFQDALLDPGSRGGPPAIFVTYRRHPIGRGHCGGIGKNQVGGEDADGSNSVLRAAFDDFQCSFLETFSCFVTSEVLWNDNLAKNSKNNWLAHNNLGEALAQRGAVAAAIQQFEESIRLNPTYLITRSNYGNILAMQGKFDQAIKEYNFALRINPKDSQTHNNLGNALSAQGHLDEAAPHYRTALELNPRNPEAHCNLGVGLAAQGKIEEARLHFEIALRQRHDYPEARRQIQALSPYP